MTVIIAVVMVTMGVAALAAPQEHYASRYEHLDITTILNNRRMVTYYANCLLSKGPCPPQGLELKTILPEALQTNCARCSEKQRTAAYRSIRRLKKEYPKIWEQLAAQWDPDNAYIDKFEATFENRVQSQASFSPAVLSTRFDDSDQSYSTNNIANASPSSITVSSFAYPPTSTTIKTSTITITTTKPTTNIIINKPTNPVTVIKPTLVTPLNRVGANIQATVSFGTNVVGGIVRGLEDLGSRVLQTGAQIADAVASAIRP